MSIIEDAYEYGKSYGSKNCEYGYKDRLKCLVSARTIATSLVSQFFKDYPDYRYNQINASIVFQAIYFGTNDNILDYLKHINTNDYKKFSAMIFAENLYSDLTGEKGSVRRVLPQSKTPLEALEETYTIETGLQPSDFVKRQLQYIQNSITQIAKKAGRTENNVNWNEVELHLQPNQEIMPRESINETIEDYREIFTPTTMREELRDAMAIYNDHRYGIIIAWYGGSTFNVFYKQKEIGMWSVSSPPRNANEAEQIMKTRAEEDPNFPEDIANDQETYNELISLKRGTKKH